MTATFNNSRIIAVLDGVEIGEDTARAAAALICKHARDIGDAQLLLEICGLAGIEPPAALTGYVLIAIDEREEKPVIVSDLDPAHLTAALAGVLAVLTADALEVEES